MPSKEKQTHSGVLFAYMPTDLAAAERHIDVAA